MFYIFDWDGTISDSASKIIQCLQMAAEDNKLPALSDASVKNIIGLGLPEAIKTLYPTIDHDRVEKLAKSYSVHFMEQDKSPSPFFPLAMETLTQLRDDNFILAIATGKSRRGLNRVLSNLSLNGFFHYSRCADETASKPNPKMLEELLEESACDVNEAVMIGDTEWDMLMANKIGMRKIAVNYGAHSKERLEKCSPEMQIECFSQILDWGW